MVKQVIFRNGIFQAILMVTLLMLFSAWNEPEFHTLSAGIQPQVSIDTKGIVRVVFGRNDSIFCATSINQGKTFSASIWVAKVKEMHIGMGRGPQIASSVKFSVITAMDKSGEIHFFQLDHKNDKWVSKGFINDTKSSAPEGLMSIAADNRDNFYAVWLDTRQDKKNNIYFSSLMSAESKWSKNKLVYLSPDSHVCECCKPNLAVSKGKLAIMFRNWLGGSRDLYLVKSDNQGKTFEMAQKLGLGTWKLNGCPMDGGGLAFDDHGKIQTTWQREGIIYTCTPGDKEVKLAAGRGCVMAHNSKNNQWVVAYQEGENAKLVEITENKELMAVKGSSMKPLVLANGKILCFWELNKTIMFRLI